jgi:hypothetical protein
VSPHGEAYYLLPTAIWFNLTIEKEDLPRDRYNFSQANSTVLTGEVQAIAAA